MRSSFAWSTGSGRAGAACCAASGAAARRMTSRRRRVRFMEGGGSGKRERLVRPDGDDAAPDRGIQPVALRVEVQRGRQEVRVVEDLDRADARERDEAIEN